MAKYAVMVVLDLDVTILSDSKGTLEVEKIEEVTKDRVRTGLEGSGITIKMLRTKPLGLAEGM